eukprot:TRINITY_DN15183_c0_g1_i1.p1 TRINITY_DN15183_c0_g1~~TRINITY_DN15183_c0_g1_i1.p1  ORF type:complete len:233 (-),score=38.52 TRINITY_DN15183_c0_g1_i1:85-783(-)
MCIRDRYQRRVHGDVAIRKIKGEPINKDEKQAVDKKRQTRPLEEKKDSVFLPHPEPNSGAQMALALQSEKCRSISFSHELGGTERSDRLCRTCGKNLKELMLSESRCIALAMENKALRRQIRVMQFSALSGIHPAPPAEATVTVQPQLESLSLLGQGNMSTKYICGTGDDGSDELRHRIDFLMAELTRLMDNLENPASQNNTIEPNFENTTHNNSLGASATGARPVGSQLFI